MKRRPKHRRFVIAVLSFLVPLGTRTIAQELVTPQPSGGLFGATHSDVTGRDALTFLLDGSEAASNEVPAELRPDVPSNFSSGGLSTLGIVSGDYARTRRRYQLSGTGTAAFRYDQRAGELAAVNSSGAIAATIRLPRQGDLQLVESAAYAPAYLFSLFPGVLHASVSSTFPADPEYRVDSVGSVSYTSRAAVGFGQSAANRFVVSGERSRTEYRQDPTERPVLSYTGLNATFSHALSRHETLTVGYQYRTGDFGLGGPTAEHRAMVGIEYWRSLAATRRATFRFNLSPAIVQVPEGLLTAGQSVPAAEGIEGIANGGERRLYQLQGDAGVTYQFRRNWQADASYRRGLEYLPPFAEPVFTDGAQARMAGLVTYRTDVTAEAGYASGGSALYRDTQDLRTYTGAITLRHALSRSWAVYSEAVYYHYELRGQARLAPGLPPRFDERELRVGFMIFTQPMRRAESGNSR